MAIVKCQNPQCDYFQKPVPEGDFCPFCGEPLPTKQTSPPPLSTPSIQVQPLPTPIAEPPIPAPPLPLPIAAPQAPTAPPVQAQPPTPIAAPQAPTAPPVQAQPPTPIAAPPSPPLAFSFPQDSPATVYEGVHTPYPTLKLTHTSGKEFFAMAGQKIYIGRRGGTKKPHPEIDLTDIPYAERVSRPHAHIFWDEQSNHYMIVDNQSTNGTKINGEFLKPWHPYPLYDGAILELGKEQYIKFTVQIRS
ncbi:FHA domain-containing protein [Gloeothece verrucosa]|uniref:FHA domain containing protein n=1 Tax=Gloeothece verrucosa (strain PCC 7822) TaxID=497965 RepID=E0UAQ8_GLOV7|nr:FHA domain-containing protein [Gloeothece verrucosa]ADN13910.1 FHA domain containing protein [Gloeothece verrucosa PCC 7822]